MARTANGAICNAVMKDKIDLENTIFHLAALHRMRLYAHEGKLFATSAPRVLQRLLDQYNRLFQRKNKLFLRQDSLDTALAERVFYEQYLKEKCRFPLAAAPRLSKRRLQGYHQ